MTCTDGTVKEPDWDGEARLVATPTDSPTATNLAATRAVRMETR